MQISLDEGTNETAYEANGQWQQWDTKSSNSAISAYPKLFHNKSSSAKYITKTQCNSWWLF